MVPEDLGAVIVVLHRVLYEAEAIDVTDIGMTVGPEKIEPTDSLLQRKGTLRTVMHINNSEADVTK